MGRVRVCLCLEEEMVCARVSRNGIQHEHADTGKEQGHQDKKVYTYKIRYIRRTGVHKCFL